MLTWYRSWPAAGEPTAGRARVEDSLPRLLMSGCDYATAQLPEDEPGFCMLEWDVALDRTGRDLFAALAEADPERVLVAPYPIFPVGSTPVVVHKAAESMARVGHRRPIEPGQAWAHSFGFGCIYLPQSVLAGWRSAGRQRMTDATFSDWHIAAHATVEVTWRVSPQHLHGD